MIRSMFAALLVALGSAATADAPTRVVSMNLCTDQLAMMLAAPGQLVSVSDWAVRPAASNMVGEASRLTVNGGSAEEIFLLHPDLVLAGSFSNPVTVDMLRRLGVRVEIMPAARSMAEISETIFHLGSILGRDAEAAKLIDDFEAALAAEAARAESLPRAEAAYHYPNNYTSGTGTLAAEVMAEAGFDNAAARLGLSGTARIALETLVMERPFLIRTEPISGNTLGHSYDSGRHPALAALGDAGEAAMLAERWQVCGTPFILRAVAALIDARLAADRREAGGAE